MKKVVVVLVSLLATAGSTQQSMKTFTSPDGLFRFKYPDMLVNCAAEQTTDGTGKSGTSEGEHILPDSCVSREPLCSGPESDGRSLACFAYPKEKFRDKPHFLGAAFFVSEIPSAKTKAECVTGSPKWLVINSSPQMTKVNGIAFKTFEIEDNWAGGGQSGSVFRTFHRDICYELGIQIAISRAEYDPGTVKEFTEQDRSEVEGRLEQALYSFILVK